jgi:hypothetical protein
MNPGNPRNPGISRDTSTAYQEVQRFSPGLMALVAAFILLTALFVTFSAPQPDRIVTFCLASAPIFLIALFYSMVQLRTEVRNGSLAVRLAPFGGMSIPVKDIRSTEVVEYKPLRDFGGWGVRYGSGGKMYSARGNHAVKLEVESKGTVYIGSENPRELAAALNARGPG